MNALAQLLEDQPALIGTLSAAIVGLVIALGVDPLLGAAVGGVLTVAAGLWVKAQVYTARTVTALVNAGAQQAVTALTAADTGQGGQITTAGEAVAKQAAADVLAGVELPGPTDQGGT